MTPRRWPFVAFLVLLLLGAAAAGAASTRRPDPPSVAARVATLTQNTDAVWFCPGFPPTLPRSAGRVSITNLGDVPAEIVVTNYPDKGDAQRRTLTVEPSTVVTRPRAQLGSPGALTIETFGGRVVVEEGVQTQRALESAPCATRSSAHWYFAAGTTVRGVQQSLVIANPYASDAKVEVTLRIGRGRRSTEQLQSIDIARRSRVVIGIDAIAVREERVAVQVDASIGSVVAGQALMFGAESGTPGVAWTIGAPQTSSLWTFAGGTVQAGANAGIAIVNHGSGDVDVELTAVSDPEQVLPPTSVVVSPESATWVQLGRCTRAVTAECLTVPGSGRYSLVVRGDDPAQLSAQILTRYTDTRAAVGAVTSIGSIDPGPDWVFARRRLTNEGSASLALFNPNRGIAHVGIALVHEGRVDLPAALQNVEVPPGQRVDIRVLGATNQLRFDAGLVVHATQPLFVERSIVGVDEVARSVGVAVG